MALKLKGVKPDTVKPGRAKVLISGESGVGKTTVAIQFPNVVYQDHEGGARERKYTEQLQKSGALYFGPEEGSLSMDDVIEQGRAMRALEHPYKTTVHDSITELLLIAQAEEADRLDAADISNEFGSDRRPGARKMRRLLAIYSGTDMNVVFIAHSKAEWKKVGNKREQVGNTADTGYDKLRYALDLWIDIEQQGKERYMRVKKSRHENFVMGEKYPWTYDDFAKRFGRERIEGAVETTKLVDEETLKQILVYREIGVINADNEAAWFKKCGGVEDWADITADQSVKLLDWCKKKLEGKDAA